MITTPPARGTSPMRTLPEGSRVGEELHIMAARITRFPQHMQVGKLIRPWGNMQDIQAFMKGRRQPMVLASGASEHERLATRARLSAFPDLLTCVSTLKPRQRLHINPAFFEWHDITVQDT